MAHLGGCCVLCFVLLPKESSVLKCHHISYFEKWKLWAMFFGKFLRRSNYDWEKLQKKKRYCVSFFGECSQMSPYFIFWKMKIMSYVFRKVSSLMKLWPEKITTGKIRYAKSEPVQLCGCVVFFIVVPTKSELPPKLFAGK